MMVIDHIAVGILQVSMLKKFRNSTAMAIGIISSVFADVYIIFNGFPGTIGYLSHRIITNSFILAPFLCIIPLAIIYFPFRKHLKNNLFELYLFSLVAYCGHIFLDLITPFGTQLLYPFSHKIYSLDFFHSFDPFFMVISLAVIVVFLKTIKSGRFLNLLAIFIFLCLYFSYAGIIGVRKFIISEEYETYINELYPDACYEDTIPRTFWRWKGIARSADKFIVVAKESDGMIQKEYPIISNLPSHIKTDKYFLRFVSYARFPVVILEKEKVNFMNLVYSPESYRLILKIGDDGSIIEYQITGFKILDRQI